MHVLQQQMCSRFPEMQHRLDAAMDPYLLMFELVQFLSEMPRSELESNWLKRIAEFIRWCEAQARGENAADDLLTMMVVGFYEEIIKLDALRFLIPHCIDRGEITKNKDYLINWVGEENYRLALAEFDRA